MQENPVQPSLSGVTPRKGLVHQKLRSTPYLGGITRTKSADYYRSANKAGSSARQFKHAESRFGQDKWFYFVPFDCTYCEF